MVSCLHYSCAPHRGRAPSSPLPRPGLLACAAILGRLNVVRGSEKEEFERALRAAELLKEVE